VNARHTMGGRPIEVTRAVVKGLVHLKTPKIYVSGLPFEATEEEIKSFFSRFGAVERVEIIKHHDSGLSRGFGFVTFQDIESVKSALHSDLTFRDRRLVVRSAEPKSQEATPYYQGGGRGYYSRGPPPPYHGYDGYGYQTYGPPPSRYHPYGGQQYDSQYGSYSQYQQYPPSQPQGQQPYQYQQYDQSYQQYPGFDT